MALIPDRQRPRPRPPEEHGDGAGHGEGGGRRVGRDGQREGRDVMQQRIYVGITGLAAVFLLTLLAASIFAMLGQDARPAPPPPPGSAAANRLSAENPPKEPLAELGVAPGNAPKPAPPAAPRPRPLHH